MPANGVAAETPGNFIIKGFPLVLLFANIIGNKFKSRKSHSDPHSFQYRNAVDSLIAPTAHGFLWNADSTYSEQTWACICQRQFL